MAVNKNPYNFGRLDDNYFNNNQNKTGNEFEGATDDIPDNEDTVGQVGTQDNYEAFLADQTGTENEGSGDNQQPFGTDRNLYMDEAGEQAQDIYSPLIEGQEQALEATDESAQIQIKGLQEQIPYITRQFEQYQAKMGLATGVQIRQMNELTKDIANMGAKIFEQAELQKYNIRSKMAEYQSAMAQGQMEIAEGLYNQALSEAQMRADLGFDYVQPELQFVYDQMITAQNIMSDPQEDAGAKSEAQNTYNTLQTQLKDMGYSGDIGEGIKTYQQQQAEFEQAQAEYQLMLDQQELDFEMFSQHDTIGMLMAISKPEEHNLDLSDKGAVIEFLYTNYPYADLEDVMEYLNDLNGMGG
jgi:hypothetical protein